MITVYNILKLLIIAVLEGISEFLPISSTGHQIIIYNVINIEDINYKLLNIVIQLGAIIALIWEFRKKLSHNIYFKYKDFIIKILIAVFPSGILGLLLIEIIYKKFFNILTVACCLIIGGIIIIFVEKDYYLKSSIKKQSIDEITWQDSLKIGLAQCLSIMPGVSRSCVTISVGLLLGLSRSIATEYSFFLAIPTIISASLFYMYKNIHLLEVKYLPIFIIGMCFSFMFALISVRILLKFISTNSYVIFAWYRIAVGFILLIFYK